MSALETSNGILVLERSRGIFFAFVVWFACAVFTAVWLGQLAWLLRFKDGGGRLFITEGQGACCRGYIPNDNMIFESGEQGAGLCRENRPLAAS
jgi:hypothetical protein